MSAKMSHLWTDFLQVQKPHVILMPQRFSMMPFSGVKFIFIIL